ncbi:unnamed protein product [Allacma fusca]|uniref:Aldehyde dehydrogenase domain-containing protein n=1 Tax=Allacma fusca TaxID=39272 RepID=A0A8J2L8E6_9HEXA|nr:unnamed protein product [Allacma fusca]
MAAPFVLRIKETSFKILSALVLLAHPRITSTSCCFTMIYREATKMTIWGKLVNNGQICVAPGYGISSEKIQDFFVRHAKVVLKGFYGDNLRKTLDLPRSINKQNFHR